MNQTVVRYESECVFVSIFHDRPSYEMGVAIGLLEDESRLDSLVQVATSEVTIGRLTGEYEFTLDEIVQYSGECDGESFMMFAGTPEQITSGVRRLAYGLRRFGIPLLDGEHRTFENLAQRRTQAAAAFTREQRLAQLRRQVERAWRDRRLSSVIQFLEEIGHDMTPAEKKKLQYAKEHLT